MKWALIIFLLILPGVKRPGVKAAPPSTSPLRSHSDFPWSRRTGQDRRGFYEQPAGLCEDYPEDDRSPQKLRRDFETMRQTGVRLLRCGISWLEVERAPGRYDWSFWDRFVAMADRCHITLLPYICYTPEWAGQASSDFWRLPPRDTSRFEQFMATIAGRYRGRVRSWELWNEPDNPHLRSRDTDQRAGPHTERGARLRA